MGLFRHNGVEHPVYWGAYARILLAVLMVLVPVALLFASFLVALNQVPWLSPNMGMVVLGAVSFFGGLMYFGVPGEKKLLEGAGQ